MTENKLIWAGAGMALVLVIAAAAGAVYLLITHLSGTNTTVTAAPTSAAQENFECTSIKHEYESWRDGADELAFIVSAPEDVALYELEQLGDDGEALLKAVSNHDDQPSKDLAVDVATYNYELNLIEFNLKLGGGLDLDQYDKTLQAWTNVETGYEEFAAATC